MKHSTILLFFLLFNIPNVIPQTQIQPKYQVGISIFSYKFLPEIFPPAKYQFFYLNDISFKRNRQKVSFRALFDFCHFTETTPIHYEGFGGYFYHQFSSYYGKEWFKALNLKFGIQRNILIKKYLIYFGADVSNVLTLYNIKLRTIDEYSKYKVFQNTYWLGMNLFIGMEHSLYKKISIGFESSYCLNHKVYSKTNITEISPAKFQYYMNPLSRFFINYNF